MFFWKKRPFGSREKKKARDAGKAVIQRVRMGTKKALSSGHQHSTWENHLKKKKGRHQFIGRDFDREGNVPNYQKIFPAN